MFIKAQDGPSNFGEIQSTVHYYDEQGNLTIRSGGSRAWRNNNPGNLVANNFTMSRERDAKAIGKAAGFVVYPDYQTGHRALLGMLGGKKWGEKTLRQASLDYTPDNLAHIQAIVKETGFDADRKIKSLTSDELERYCRAIEKIEKWKPGKEEFVDRWYITGVHLKNGVIQEYCISCRGNEKWISKADAVLLAERWQIHAVVIHCKNGINYLRPEFKSKRFKDLAC